MAASSRSKCGMSNSEELNGEGVEADVINNLPHLPPCI